MTPARTVREARESREARLDSTLRALSDPARRGVVDLLRVTPQRAGELARALSMTPPALSRHLRLLRKSGLVEETSEPDDARVRIYCLRRERFTELSAWLTELDAFWTEQLGAFAAHANATAATAAVSSAASAATVASAATGAATGAGPAKRPR